MTTAFWISAAGLTVLVLAALLFPLMRAGRAPLAKRADFDLTVYKDQLAEVDRDQERGVLNDDQAIAARTEIERRMLAAADDAGATETGAVPDDAKARPRITGALIGAVLVALPLGAVWLYNSLGNPGLADQPLASRNVDGGQRTAGAQDGARSAADRMEQLRAAIRQMEKRAEEEPDNPQVWGVLGQANQMLGNHDEAVKAFRQLVEVTDRHPEALIVLAEALFAQAGEQVTPEALKLFKEARTQDPENPMTYYYGALEREQAGDLQGALNEYEGLLAVSPENGDWVPAIQQRMAALAGELGVEVPVVEMLPPVEQAPQPTPEQMQQAQDMSPEEQQAMIQSMVERLAARLAENPDDLAGWRRLAQAYRVLGDEEGLAKAEAEIQRLEQGG